MAKILTLYSQYGQSLWLDYIDRNLLMNGGLRALVENGIRGVTTNPTIFLNAVTNSSDYDDTIRDLIQADHQIGPETLYQWLTLQDVQMAADILTPVYESSHGTDGYVSHELSPHLAYNTDATLEAARHLWRAVDRPNLMIKVPGTLAGLSAIETLIAEGINVNVTLLFSISRYQAVSEAYLRGLANNPTPRNVASVASFFVSRVDTMVDKILAEMTDPAARALMGKVAIANTRLAYQHYQQVKESEQFRVQQARGARMQRPLWASTSTKNPAYSDILYVEQLIGPEVINTVTPATLDAFQVHGEIMSSLEKDIHMAQRDLDTLAALGGNLDEITEKLEIEGVRKFIQSYDQLLRALHDKRSKVGLTYAAG